MERDFHYYAIAVLARAAGFREDDARLVAWASQYVDDSKEGNPIHLGRVGFVFEPVHSAHIGLRAFDWSVQKRVYMPFHFLPPKPSMRPGDPWQVQADSPFARSLIHRAVKNVPPGYPTVRCSTEARCELGIALHTYADTWSHEGFSGRHDRENNVSALELKESNGWDRLVFEGWSLNLWMPEIGHAEAGFYPDLPYHTWRWRRGRRPWRPRDNTQAFLKAAKAIFARLRKCVTSNGHPSMLDRQPTWQDLRPRFKRLFGIDGDRSKRCKEWHKEFRKFFSDDWHYEEKALEKKARAMLRPVSKPNLSAFYSSTWVAWQRAALRQRHFVLERLL